MSTTQDSPTSNIRFSVDAAQKVAELIRDEIRDEKNPALHFRLSIIGGGCSGFQYSFSFDEEIKEFDTEIEQTCKDGTVVKLLIDYLSIPYLEGAEIDYSTGIQGEQFIIRNPSAKTTCGCGSSFSVDDE